MNQTYLLLIISILILSLSIYVFTKKDKLVEYYHHNSDLHNSILNRSLTNSNSNKINNFTTNKFNYPAGPINNLDCSNYCEERYKNCLSYTVTGESNLCSYLKDECTQDCKWNSIFNQST